jgi:hypothetical protein
VSSDYGYLGTRRDLGVTLEVFNNLPGGKPKPREK